MEVTRFVAGEGSLGQRQYTAIAEAITELMTAGDDGATLCCTVETRDAAGNEVSVQVMQDSINISPYAHPDDPLDRLETCGALEGLDDVDLEVVDWEAGTYATIGTEDLVIADVAQLVDQVFTKLLGCDENYSPAASTEDLG